MKQINRLLLLIFVGTVFSACSLAPGAQVPATATPTPWLTPTSAQQLLHTQGETNVHTGPGETYSISYTIPADTQVAVIGRNLNNTWWVVPDNGNDGLGWVTAEKAEVSGNSDSLPILAAPTLTPTPVVLFIQNPASPPSDLCIAHRPGQFPPPDVYHVATRQSDLIAQLGNWAEVLKTEGNWHLIFFGPSLVGWVNNGDVDLTGPC